MALFDHGRNILNRLERSVFILTSRLTERYPIFDQLKRLREMFCVVMHTLMHETSFDPRKNMLKSAFDPLFILLRIFATLSQTVWTTLGSKVDQNMVSVVTKRHMS